MISPPLGRTDNLQEFLYGHIQLDIQHIAKCSALSTDDTILMIHDVINRMKGGW